MVVTSRIWTRRELDGDIIKPVEQMNEEMSGEDTEVEGQTDDEQTDEDTDGTTVAESENEDQMLIEKTPPNKKTVVKSKKEKQFI